MTLDPFSPTCLETSILGYGCELSQRQTHLICMLFFLTKPNQNQIPVRMTIKLPSGT